MAKYGKAVAAVIYAALTAAYQISAAGGVPDATGWVQIGIAGVTAVGVYLVPLAPSAPWTKTAVAVVLAALQVLVTVVAGGVDTNELLMIAIAVFGALDIRNAPAESADSAVGYGKDEHVEPSLA